MKLNHWLSSTVSRIRTSTSRRRHARRRPAEWRAAPGSANVTSHAAEALEARTLLAADWGDAPDTGAGTGTGNYETLLANTGPSHTTDVTRTTLFLGASVDADNGTLQNVRANADDVGGALPDDEDGVLNPAVDLLGTIGAQPTVTLLATNTTGSNSSLYGWIDYNNDGIFDNGTERATIDVPDGTRNGRFTLTFPAVPAGFTGETYARFRLSTDAAAADSTGPAADGEIEDYRFAITTPAASPIALRRTAAFAFNAPGGPVRAAGDLFGSSMTSLGDLDGDGVTDFAVGARGDETVHLLMLNSDSSVKTALEINSRTRNGPSLVFGDNFGVSVTSLGDLDGDGVTDIAVGASEDDGSGRDRGALHVMFLNSNGSVKRTAEISSRTLGSLRLQDYDEFGHSVTSLGDLDGDGVTDIAVGARKDDAGSSDRGAVHVLFLNSNGSVKRTVEINDLTANGPALRNGDRFGGSVTSLGDLDGDGVTEIAVGAANDDTRGNSRGAVHVLFLNANGTVKRTAAINDNTPNGPVLYNNAFFGFSAASAGDLDGDGATDLAVGAAGGSGVLFVLLMNTDGSVKHTSVINQRVPNGPALGGTDSFGSSVTSLGDLDGDGVTDLAGGAYRTAGLHGTAYILNLAPPPPEVNLSISAATGSETDATVITATATASENVSDNQTVQVVIGGPGISGGDFDRLSATITIPDGTNSGTAEFVIQNDNVIEATETATLRLANPSGGLKLGDTTTQDVVITDNDIATADLSVTRQGDEAGPIAAVFTVTLSKTNGTGAAITFDLDDLLTGSATTGIDYTPIADDAKVSVANGRSTGTLSVPVTDDSDVEGTETLIAQIANPSNASVTVNTSDATVNIADNDAVISNFVWNDTSEDGVQDAGETGRDGVTVNLLNAAGDTQLDSTITANGGLYSFLVEPGTYIVEFVSPTGTVFSPQNAGSPNDDDIDSDADVNTGRTGQITVAAGDIDDTVDAGLITDDVTPIVSINQRTTTDDTPGLSGNVDDPTADVDVTVDGTTYDATNHGDGTWTLADNAVAALDPGVHNIVVTATDAAGNVGTDSTANELSIAVRAFDFGAAGSPVAAGFTQVLTSNVIPASPSANDFGWVDNTGLQDRDRSTVASDLDRDYHKTNNLSSTFQAVVPNGEYHVTFVIGSGSDPRTNVFVAIEGTELPGSITTTPGTFHTRTELVDITDGLLDFELIRKPQTATSAGINGIILLPATLEPRLDATDALQFHRLGEGPVPVDDQFTLDDPDDTNLTGAEVRITAGFTANEDVLAFSDQNGIAGSYDGATGVLTLSGTSTVAHYQTALRSVTFDSTGTTTGGRGLQFAASDGTTGTGYDSRSLTVLPAGGAGFKFDFNADGSPTEPGHIPVGVTQAFSSGAGFGWLNDAYASNLDARDRSDGPDDLRRDYHKISSGSMTFAVDLPDGTYDVTFTIGSQQDARNGVAVSLENARVPNATTTFATLAGQFLTETHRVVVSDGRLEVKLERQGSTGISINGLEVAEVGGAPSIDLSAGSAVFESGAGAIVIDDGLTIDDIDSTDLTGATVRIVDGLNNAADSLLFSDQNGITGGYDSNLGILSLTGTTTLANYRTALRSVQFDTTDNTGTRTVQFEVDDGAEVGADTRDIFVTTPFSGTARYDFGSATSPVETNYTQVHEGSAFDPALGYGWLSTANLASRVRNSPVPLDERRDYVRIGSGSMTFAVSLPNGDYDVQLTIGSSENARNNVGVILEGTQVDTISTAVNQFATPTHRVTISDNRLEVRIERQGSSGASINALVITEMTP